MKELLSVEGRRAAVVVFAGAFAGAVAAPAPGFAASGNSSGNTGIASASAIVPLNLDHKNGSELRFSRFAGGSGGTVTVDPVTELATATGGVTFVPGQPAAADQFVATGDPNRQIAVVGGSGTITSGAWSMAVSATPAQASGTLSAAGTLAFSVGGTLTVLPNQPAGQYSGSYPVTVAYQ
jgi:hypothetical protein